MSLNTRTHKINISLPEIFDQVRDLSSKDEKVQMLKSYRELKHLKWFVNAMYNYDFSKTFVPRYTPSKFPPDMCANIWTQVKRIDSAVHVLYRAGDDHRYDKMMTLALEAMSADEAELIAHMMNGKKVDGISKRMWREVYPEFFRTEEAATSVEAGS